MDSRSAGIRLVDLVPRTGFELLLAALLISLCLQNIELFAVGSLTVNPPHVIAPLLALFGVGSRLVRQGRVDFPPYGITIVVLLFTVISLIDASRYGFDTATPNYLLLLLMVFGTVNICAELPPERVRVVVRGASLLISMLVLANAAIHWESILAYLTSPWDGHPSYPMIFNGGANIEVSWLALFGVFFDGAFGWFYLSAVLLLSVLLASRAGTLLVIAAGVYVLLFSQGRQKGVRSLRKRLPMLVAFVLAASVVVVLSGSPIVERLVSIGSDGGSMGRIGIWKTAISAIPGSPFIGYGGGNAMNVVRSISGLSFAEDNVHNLFLQILVDYGILGFIPAVFFFVRFVAKNVRVRLSSPFGAFIMLYCAVGMIQFRGGDPIIGFMIGCFCAAAQGGLQRPFADKKGFGTDADVLGIIERGTSGQCFRKDIAVSFDSHCDTVVSIVMPLHNAAEHLEETLETLRAQTFTLFEAILVDDGSTDGTAEIIQRVARLDQRFVPVSQEASGAGAARNAGLLLAKGPYIIFLDGDDLFCPRMLELMHESIEASGADICACDARAFDSATRKEIKGFTVLGDLGAGLYNADELRENLFQDFSSTPWNKMMRLEFVKRHDLKFQNIRKANDCLFVYSALLKAGIVAVLKDKLVGYRCGGGQSIQDAQGDNNLCVLQAVDAVNGIPDIPEAAMRSLREWGFESYLRAFSLASVGSKTAAREIFDEFEARKSCWGLTGEHPLRGAAKLTRFKYWCSNGMDFEELFNLYARRKPKRRQGKVLKAQLAVRMLVSAVVGRLASQFRAAGKDL